MSRIFLTIVLMTFIFARPTVAQQATQAQELVWVQIEAQPSLRAAEASARGYAARLPDVNGFALGGGWYAVALGPYSTVDAQKVAVSLRRQGVIPRDSFIAYSRNFRQQFWPVGSTALSAVTAAQPTVPNPSVPTQPAAPEFKPVDETPRQARASEARLSRDERRALQEMLKWAGVYSGGIDGAFGRGTRGSMSKWQQANGYKPTGVLTTAQRAELKRQYNAVLDGLDLRLISDQATGIEMLIPTGIVKLTEYNPPFGRFDAIDTGAAKVILISQPGDQNTLFGLYDIMQTLDIVPEDGPRKRNAASFLLSGKDDRIVSHTQVALKGGQIKGFTLVWPVGDEERRTRMLDAMQASFRRLDGVLSPSAGTASAQDINLVAGLEIRRPKLSRSGFFVDARGTVVTTAAVVEQCRRITIDGDFDADLVVRDQDTGLAILRTQKPLAPVAVARFAVEMPRLQSEVAVSGYSYEGVLGAPTLTFGKVSDIKGLNGDTDLRRLALAPLSGDAGGPVIDASGAVLGMLMSAPEGRRKLPPEVSFVAGGDAIRALAAKANVVPQVANVGAAISPVELVQKARGMTVLVSCW